MVLHWDEELGYVLSYSACEEQPDGTTGPKEGAEVKVLVVRGANLKAKFKGKASRAIDEEQQKLDN